MAILVVAQATGSGYEQASHELIGRDAGLTEPELDALREGENPKFADEQESAAYSAARALTVTGDVDDQEYAAAIAALGEEGLVELSTLVGYYATLALQLRIFRVPAPE
jgi:4-carboxymuconolactone decarboxylase